MAARPPRSHEASEAPILVLMGQRMLLCIRGRHSVIHSSSSRTLLGMRLRSLGENFSIHTYVSWSKHMKALLCIQGWTTNPTTFCINFWVTHPSLQTSVIRCESCLSFTSGVPTLPDWLHTEVPQETKSCNLVNRFFEEVGIPRERYWSLEASTISSSLNLCSLPLILRLGTIWVTTRSSI